MNCSVFYREKNKNFSTCKLKRDEKSNKTEKRIELFLSIVTFKKNEIMFLLFRRNEAMTAMIVIQPMKSTDMLFLDQNPAARPLTCLKYLLKKVIKYLFK